MGSRQSSQLPNPHSFPSTRSMVYKEEVVKAFSVFELTPDAPQADATKAYKKLALKYHPDKNSGSEEATIKFQELGAAWHICQRHYDNPELSKEGFTFDRSAFEGRTWNEYDDVPLDPDEAEEFFRFMFEHMMRGRYSYRTGQRYRYQRSGKASEFVYAFSGGFAEAQKRQQDNQARQKREQDEYLQRVREFEAEIAAEEAEAAKRVAETRRQANRLSDAHQRAFKLARVGQGDELQTIVGRYRLDVTLPEHPPKEIFIRRVEGETGDRSKLPKRYDTLLHVAAQKCGVETIKFLLARGADPSLTNSSSLTPFHSAILAGNTPIITHFLSMRPTPENIHPSKSFGNPACAPLDLAIQSKDVGCIELIVRYATVHDVQRVWNTSEGLPENIKAILTQKNGFIPPDDSDPLSGLTAKQRRKHEAKLASEEKERLINEQKMREAANRERKEQRRAKAIQREAEAKKQEQEKLRKLKEEEEQKKRPEEQAARLRAQEEERIKRQVEAERLKRQQEEEAQRRKLREEQERKRAEEERLQAEKKKQLQEEARGRAEEQERIRQQKEAARLKRHQAKSAKEAERKAAAAEAEARRKHQEEEEARQAEIERQRREEEERKRLEEERAREALEQAQAAKNKIAKRGRLIHSDKVCHHFARGHCRFGDKCRYSHAEPVESVQIAASPFPLPPPPPPPISEHEVPTPTPSEPPTRRPRRVCKFFSRGHCKYGKKCLDVHILPEEPSQTSAPKLEVTGPEQSLPSPSSTPSPHRARRKPASSKHPRFEPRTPVEEAQTITPATDDLFPREVPIGHGKTEILQPSPVQTQVEATTTTKTEPKQPKKKSKVTWKERLAEKDRELERLNGLLASMQAGTVV